MAANDGSHELSLPSLQNHIKRDALAYRSEFDLQYQHFDSQLELFALKPQKPAKHFSELLGFLSHVTPCYGQVVAAQFAQRLMSILGEHFAVLHPKTREVLVGALILLRNKKQISCMESVSRSFCQSGVGWLDVG